jgi:hypothetical protein
MVRCATFMIGRDVAITKIQFFPDAQRRTLQVFEHAHRDVLPHARDLHKFQRP